MTHPKMTYPPLRWPNGSLSLETFLMPRSTIPSSSLFSDLKPRLKNLLIEESKFSGNQNFRTIENFKYLSLRSIKYSYLILETLFDSSDIFPFILVDLRILFFGLDFELESLDWFDWSFSNVEELRFEFILELGFEDFTRIENYNILKFKV